MKSTHFTEMDSPLGTIRLCGTQQGLTGIFMQDHRHGPEEVQYHSWQRADALFNEVRAQLEEYFAGRRVVFSVEIDRVAIGGTPFQRRVWKVLEEIPYGVTISYRELARRINQPTAVRAVGLANGRNPLSIIVPCHRVIGSNGKLTGYGGGLERKQLLLELESSANAASQCSSPFLSACTLVGKPSRLAPE
jgi:methylated-DNA-[protein]-cysteine S-methyltransferase